MEDSFAHMRPYLDHEVPEAIARLVGALDWESQLSPFIGDERAADLITGIRDLRSVDAFQENLSRVFIDLLLELSYQRITATQITHSIQQRAQDVHL